MDTKNRRAVQNDVSQVAKCRRDIQEDDKKFGPGLSTATENTMNDAFTLLTQYALQSLQSDQGPCLSSAQARMLSKKIAGDLSSGSHQNREWAEHLFDDTIVDLGYWYLNEKMLRRPNNIKR
jgi:hypothetical protein